MNDRLSPGDIADLQIASLRAQIAAQEADNLRLRMFVRYGLKPEDFFDFATGYITRAAPAPAPAPEGEPAGG